MKLVSRSTILQVMDLHSRGHRLMVLNNCVYALKLNQKEVGAASVSQALFPPRGRQVTGASGWETRKAQLAMG